MQSEFLRERVRQAVGWGIEDAWPRYNRIHEPHDPDDESRQEWVDCITEQVVTALLRTPLGEGDRGIGDVHEEVARYAERGSSQNGLRLVPIPTLQRWAQRLAALRSEAQGEDELCRENERLTKAWHAAHEARRRAEDEARLWFDRYQALRSAPSGVEEGEAVATVARMIADAPMLGSKRDLARQILAYLRAAPVPAREGEEAILNAVCNAARTDPLIELGHHHDDRITLPVTVRVGDVRTLIAARLREGGGE